MKEAFPTFFFTGYNQPLHSSCCEVLAFSRIDIVMESGSCELELGRLSVLQVGVVGCSHGQK